MKKPPSNSPHRPDSPALDEQPSPEASPASTDATSPTSSSASTPEVRLLPASIAETTTAAHLADGSIAPEVVEILDAYMEALKERRAPSRDALLAEHPALREQLEACLACLDFIHRDDPPAGRVPPRLGDFLIEKEIGRGGMGTVFEAQQMSLGRRVALKILHFSPGSDSAAIDRFQREAETVASLHHTNIVPIFSVGSHRGVNYYAMQYIEGQSLDLALAEQRGPFPAALVAQWGLEAAEALAHAHQRQVVHRDVKPSNLIRDKEGRIWLTDFGLAKRLDDVALSVTGALLGTPRYMSPEQASGCGKPIDHRTDIYSLGATLYELATGRPVFSGPTPQAILRQILSEEPVPPRQHCREIPRDFETILLRCLAKDGAQRYPSAQDLADDLRALLAGRAIKARRASILERSARWLRRQRRSVALSMLSMAATIVVILASVLAGYAYHRSRMAELALLTESPGLVAEILAPDGTPLANAQTLPTQRPLDIPAGEVLVRVSGEGTLSQDTRLTLVRGERAQYDVRLDDHQIGDLIPLKRTIRVVDTPRGAVLLAIDDEGIHRMDPRGGVDRWSLEIGRDGTIPNVEGHRVVWPWNRSVQIGHSGYGKFDLRPWVAGQIEGLTQPRAEEGRLAADFNGDGEPDLVVAAQHQAWLLALSGRDGQPLWFAGRGADVTAAEVDSARPRIGPPVESAVLAPPLLLDDMDGDGAADVLASLVDVGIQPGRSTGSQPRRWLELISGASGKTIWTFELQDAWFQLPPNTEVPYALQWFYGMASGSTRSGGGVSWEHGKIAVRTDWPECRRTGPHLFVASPPRLVTMRVESTADAGDWPNALRTVIALVAGQYLVAIEPKTGQVAFPPAQLDAPPVRPPLWADMDGDGAHDAVWLEARPPRRGRARAGVGGVTPQVGVRVWSPERRETLWTRDVAARLVGQPEWSLPAPNWPLAEDLDGDGVCELLIPNGTSEDGAWLPRERPWGMLEVLDGTSGQPRWSHRVMNSDQQVNYFAAGPDVDGDGIRDVFAAGLWGKPASLFVDALAGADGTHLWWSRQPLPESNNTSLVYWITSLGWWHGAGVDEPSLVVSTFPSGVPGMRPVAYVFSSQSGQPIRSGRDLHHFWTANLNGDRRPELLAWQNTPKSEQGDDGGTVKVFQGLAHEHWRRQMHFLHPSQDYDGDGVRDMIQEVEPQRLVARSALSDRLLWEAQVDEWLGPQSTDAAQDARRIVTGRHTASGESEITGGEPFDLDGDGTADLLLCSNTFRTFAFSPLLAVSGKTGRRLWNSELQVQVIRGAPLIDAHDLDRDGQPEVILVAAMDLGFPERNSVASDDVQLWLVVMSGRDGTLRWQTPLSVAYGHTAQRHPLPYNFAITWFEGTYGDLNGDGVLDLLLPAEGEPGGGHAVLKALDGQSGTQLWEHKLPAVQQTNQRLASVVPPAIADVDGNGTIEVVSMALDDTTAGRVLSIRVLEALDGSVRWEWTTGVEPFFGDVDGQTELRDRPRPVLLRQADGTRRIAVAIRETGSLAIVVVDHRGQLVDRLPTDKETGYLRHSARLWACDIDGVGTDELVFVNDRRLRAADPAQLAQPLWQCEIADGQGAELVGGIVADDGTPTAILKGSVGDNGLYGVDARNGQMIWSCPGPAPRSEGAWITIDQVQVLRYRGHGLQECYFRYGTTAVNRRAASWHAEYTEGATLPVVASRIGTTGRRARDTAEGQQPTADDPRLLRDLPWNVLANPNEAQGLRKTILGTSFYCATLLLVPGFYAGWLYARRRWGLRTLLLMPLVALVVLAGCTLDIPSDRPLSLGQRFAGALGILPAWFLVLILGRWLISGRWRPMVASLVMSGVVAAAAAVFILRVVMPSEGVTLLPGERYSWDGWYMIWLCGLYTIGLLLLVGLPAWAVAARLWRYVHRSRASSPG